MFTSKSATMFTIGFILIVALGFGLRLYAFQANTRAYGDVNTIRTSALQYVKTGIVQYPWKLERFETTLNDPLATPAYMHGPALPFWAGLFAKLTGSLDTFTALKLLTFGAGMATLWLAYRLGSRLHTRTTGLIAMLFVATSPVLIDFSANGSPYIIATAFLLGADVVLSTFDFKRLRDYALLGGLCSLGFLSLQALLSLTAMVVLLGLWNIRRVSLQGVLLFFGVWFICYAPAMVWYFTYFGRPFVSQQLYYIAGELNLTSAQRADFITHPLSLLSPPLLGKYVGTIWSKIQVYGQNLTFELSLPLLVGAVAALITGIIQKSTRNRTTVLFFTRASYFGITSVGLALLHMRFLVPVVSGLLIIAAWGVGRLIENRGRAVSTVFVSLALAYAGWAVWSYATLDTPPTRYYRDETETNIAYDYSDEIGVRLAAFPSATIIGCDDARRMIYRTDSRFVATGCDPSVEQLTDVLNDPALNGRYLMYTNPVIEGLRPNFPNAVIIVQNEMFAVLDLAPAPE